MQTSPKTPKKIFATRLLGVTLCLVISLSAVITPARGQLPDIPALFDGIASDLADQGIASNIGNVTDGTDGAVSNWTAFPDLYFEKRTDVNDSATAIGRMTFTELTDFSSPDTQAFLLALQTKMQMGEGYIALDLSDAAGFQSHPAILVMYGLPHGITFDELVVSDDAGNIIDITGIVEESSFSQDPVTGDVTFSVAHFTKFQIFPFHIYLPLIIR